VIVPLFGFANAGITLGQDGLQAALSPLPLAVAAGLFIGKQLGVLGALTLTERTGFAQRPAGTTLVQLWGIAALCGIGFTMSLFIANLAFPASPDLVDRAKLGIMAGSLLSALLGFVLLRRARAGS
jgi:NhaA family Na+:H+ antiporter